MAATTPSTITAEPSRFSIRLPHWGWFLLAAVLLILASVGLGIAMPAYRQYVAIRELKRIGGKVYHTMPVGSAWLRKILGSNFVIALDEIDSIGFYPREDTFWGRWPSSGWTGPTKWTESGPEVDDSSLACVRGFPNLKHLELSCTNISDAGVPHFVVLRNLESLDVEYTDISDASIPLLKKLAKLKQLQLEGTQITDEGIAELRRAMPSLNIVE